jgi:hypothetical protein
MSRLDDYRTALLAAHADVADDALVAALDERAGDFASFIIDHGLGPLWHERTGRAEFHESRMLAEAMFLAQERALREIGPALDAAGIDHVVIKGAANRMLCYDNPAVRACFDIDLLVRPGDRVTAATALVDLGFAALADEVGISRELELTRGDAAIDLHWGLLREGRLGTDLADGMLKRRRKLSGMWMQSSEDALFTLLVHPAFAKHLAGWNMGLHRVADLLCWLRSQAFDWPRVHSMLEDNGVCVAAWAALRWVDLLATGHAPATLESMRADLQPGRLRQTWLDYWLRNDLPDRTSHARWTRLLGFSMFLHDAPGDALRAARGRRQARGRSKADLDAFADLFVERAGGE